MEPFWTDTLISKDHWSHWSAWLSGKMFNVWLINYSHLRGSFKKYAIPEWGRRSEQRWRRVTSGAGGGGGEWSKKSDVTPIYFCIYTNLLFSCLHSWGLSKILASPVIHSYMNLSRYKLQFCEKSEFKRIFRTTFVL